MSDNFATTIANEVRSILSSVEDLETIKFRTVIRILEGRLHVPKGGLDTRKSLIKNIIKEEAKNEFDRRESGKNDSKEQTAKDSAISYELEAYSAAQNDGLDIEPKRCSNAYMLYCSEKRNALKAEFPNMSSADIIREAGNSWRALSAEEKRHYVELSDLDHSRYSRELEELRQNKYLLLKRKPETRAKSESSSAHTKQRLPKKARSAYIFYCLKNRSRVQAENEGLNPMDVSRRLGAEWNKLSTEEKEPFKQEEIKDRERYTKELKALGLTVEGLRKSNRYSLISASKEKSAYLYFCSLKREEYHMHNPQLSSNEINKQLNEIWSRMTEEEKQRYEENAFDDKDRIRREVEKVKQNIKDPLALPSHKAKKMKRPRTSYALFYKEQMAQLREQNESLPFGEISKKLSVTWKALPEDQRQRYVQLSKKEQETRNNMISDEGVQRIAYDVFYKQRYPQLQDKLNVDTKEEIMNQINNEWTTLDPGTRFEFYRKFISEKEAKNEMMENEQTMMMMNNQGTTQNEDHYDTPN